MNHLTKVVLFVIWISIFAKDATSQNISYVCHSVPDEIKPDCYKIPGNSLTNLLPSRLSKNTLPLNASSSLYMVHVWVMVPFEERYIFSLDHIRSAVEKSLSDAGAIMCDDRNGTKDNVLQDVCFRVEFNDTKCDADYAQNKVSDIQNDRYVRDTCGLDYPNDTVTSMDVIVGMSCDYAAGRIASFSNHWSWPSIFVGTRTTVFDEKEGQVCCGTMTRTGPTASDLGKFVTSYFEKNNWTISYLVYTDVTNHGAPVYAQANSDCSTYIGGISNQFFNLKNWTSNENYNILGYKSDTDIKNQAETILNTIKNNARVSVWCIGRDAMRYVMNKSHEMGMTDGSFAFLYIDMYNTNTSYEWSDVDDQQVFNETYDLTCPVQDSDPLAPIRALQVISLYQPETSTYRNFSDTMKEEEEKLGISDTMEFVNPYVVEYYHAIQLLIIGLNRTFQSANVNLSDGQAFAERIWNLSFESVDGLVTISETGDRLMEYTIMDMDPKTGKFETAIVYFGSNQSYVPVKPIDWPGAVAPVNIPECGFTGCPANRIAPGLIIAIALAVLMALLLLILCFVMQRRLENEKTIRKMAWAVNYRDLNEMDTNGGSSSNGSTLSRSISGSIQLGNGVGRQIFTTVVRFKDQIVAVKILQNDGFNITRDIKVEMQQMMSLNHEHLCKFIGAGIVKPVFLLTEYCPRGSLQDVLEDKNDEYELDDDFRNSLMSDIAHGMQYLHRSPLISHGNLKSSNCLVDSRFVVKISGFGMVSLRKRLSRRASENETSRYQFYRNTLWKAPELLRQDNPPLRGTQKGDVYSFAIIMQEIMYRKGVFFLGVNETEMSPQEIYEKVINSTQTPFRPTLDHNDEIIVPNPNRNLIKECWDETPERRPTFAEIMVAINKKYKQRNLVDSLLKRLEQYSNHLEEKVKERTQQVQAEKERADDLLCQMLPKSVSQRLMAGMDVLPESYKEVTIYFSDIVGFTAISHDSTPKQVVEMLNGLYTEFDKVVDTYDVYKVETIGDAYMVVSGLPVRNGDRHAIEIARMALSLKQVAENFKIDHMPDTKLKIRIGIHSGPVVAGVVGLKMPRYCLFGDTVNTAARMEQNGKAMKIHISPRTKELMEEDGSFLLERREDEVYMKGLGSWRTWWLTGLTEEDPVKSRISGSSGYSTTSTLVSEGSSYFLPSTPRSSIPGMENNELLDKDICGALVGDEIEEEDGKKSVQKTKRRGIGVATLSQQDLSALVNTGSVVVTKTRRNGSAEGRSEEMLQKIPSWSSAVKKNSASGISRKSTSSKKEAKERKNKRRGTHVKFNFDFGGSKNSIKEKDTGNPIFHKLSRDSGIEVQIDNKAYEFDEDSPECGYTRV